LDVAGWGPIGWHTPEASARFKTLVGTHRGRVCPGGAQLSRLSGDARFEAAALTALRKLWSLRTEHDLLGQSLNVKDGRWLESSAGIGAGMDSFYEYLLKAYIMYGEPEYYHMFQKAYLAVLTNMRIGAWCVCSHLSLSPNPLSLVAVASAPCLSLFAPRVVRLSSSLLLRGGWEACCGVLRSYGVHRPHHRDAMCLCQAQYESSFTPWWVMAAQVSRGQHQNHQGDAHAVYQSTSLLAGAAGPPGRRAPRGGEPPAILLAVDEVRAAAGALLAHGTDDPPD